MPRRSTLSATERESLLTLPDAKDELIRHYTFNETDLSVIRHRRTARTSEPAAKQKALVISTRSMEAVQDGLSTPISPTSTRPSVPRLSFSEDGCTERQKPTAL